MHFNRFPLRHSASAKLMMAALICAAGLNSACAPEESAVRDDFRNSVRAMIAAQTYQPGKEAPSLDGGKAVRHPIRGRADNMRH